MDQMWHTNLLLENIGLFEPEHCGDRELVDGLINCQLLDWKGATVASAP